MSPTVRTAARLLALLSVLWAAPLLLGCATHEGQDCRAPDWVPIGAGFSARNVEFTQCGFHLGQIQFQGCCVRGELLNDTDETGTAILRFSIFDGQDQLMLRTILEVQHVAAHRGTLFVESIECQRLAGAEHFEMELMEVLPPEPDGEPEIMPEPTPLPEQEQKPSYEL